MSLMKEIVITSRKLLLRLLKLTFSMDTVAMTIGKWNYLTTDSDFNL